MKSTGLIFQRGGVCPVSARLRPVLARVVLVLCALLSGGYHLASEFKADVERCELLSCGEGDHYFIDTPHNLLEREYQFLPHAYESVSGGIDILLAYLLFCCALFLMRMRDAALVAMMCLAVSSLHAVISMFADFFMIIWFPYSVVLGLSAVATFCFAIVFFARRGGFFIPRGSVWLVPPQGHMWKAEGVEGAAGVLGILCLAYAAFGGDVGGIFGLSELSSWLQTVRGGAEGLR